MLFFTFVVHQTFRNIPVIPRQAAIIMRFVHAAIAALYVLGASSSRPPAVDITVRDSTVATVQERQASSYWYENISHQGISATAPSGYKVFRNVKDYGAKGMTSNPSDQSLVS